jgi:isoleucyl-tRNA synthetase
MGDFEGMTREEIVKKYPKALYYLVKEHYYWKNIPNGESFISVKERVDKFIEEVNKNYRGKTILVFSHAGFLDMLYVKFNNGDYQKGLGHHGKNCSVEKYNLVEMVNLHRPAIDGVILKCPQCGDKAYRTSDVLDCWFESGSMPYAQWHYPFENQNKFENSFPADFIAEGLDQTRGWFYTLIVLSTALFNKPAFKNVIVNGIVLAEDGQKMSKRLKNYPEPNILIEKYGADALRYYLITSPAMKSENLRFSEKGVDEVLKKFILTLWNAYSFLVMNVNLDKNVKEIIRQIQNDKKKSDNLLDRWIVSELNILVQEVNKQMENYDLVRASRPLRDFSDKLSNWYVRRSRKRFSSEDIKDRNFAFQTLYYVLIEYSKLLAPFMPFLAEEIYKNLTEKESVHLEDYPVADKKLIDKKISDEMNFVRQIVTLGLAIRAKHSVKVRMPLSELRIIDHKLRIKEEFLDLIKDELNVKSVEFVDALQIGSTQENGDSNSWVIGEEAGLKIALDLNLTEELKNEGLAREIVRHIQVMRKEAKYDRDDIIEIKYNFKESSAEIKKVFDAWMDYIKKECLAENVEFVDKLSTEDFDSVKEIEIGNWKLEIGIKKS